jgi:hypothetical protein
MVISDIHSGDTALVDGDTRVVSTIIKNTDGNSVILWRGRKDEGACMPSLWRDWQRGKPQNKRGR